MKRRSRSSLGIALVAGMGLVVGCGDEGSSAATGETTGASTGATTADASGSSSGASTGAATMTGEPTATGDTTGDTTGGGTTGGDTTGGDTTGGDTTGEPTTTGRTTDGGMTTGDTSTTGEDGLLLPWTYIAAEDRGIRDDDYGLGAFQAPRKSSKHSGIDLSMPIGTELYAPCDGAYLAGYDGGYGNWVQVICPVPKTIAGEATVFASVLFAHLDATEVAITGVNPNDAGVVSRGQVLGTSGKSGNANVPGLNAHLHFEVALVDSELAGLEETHASGVDYDTEAASALRASLAETCLDPYSFAAKGISLNLGRRIDPFIFMSCLAGDKPALVPPGDQALHAWSDDYSADFDVDVGLQP